jgi:hypothetical protein
MILITKRLGCLAAAGLLAIGPGCGGGRPSVDTSTAEATVSGTVTVDGKPASGCTISFDPSNVERKDATASTAEIGEDGSYSVTTLVGQNLVSFSGPLVSKYPDIVNGAFMHDLTAGPNTIDFALPDEGAAGY